MANRSIANALAVAPLAIGLLSNTGVKQPAAVAQKASAAVCAVDLASCPVSGCADPKSDPAHALINQMKRREPSGPTKPVTFDDFSALQRQADQLVGQDKPLDRSARDKLKDMKVSGGLVAEGDVVQLTGFLVGSPHPNAGESVNCELTGQSNNDFHIPIAAEARATEFEGIVVEMIPQARRDGWDLAKLRKLAGTDKQVRVTGQLLYDNMHRVNKDPEHEEPGQPKRFSLWEIHRVTAFEVCRLTECKTDPTATGWDPLEKVAAADLLKDVTATNAPTPAAASPSK
ncbi:MAG TPA: hypothetical protein VKU19_32800 [Bryobacteraceae bacterium]|nr:hypothetical protein [Bryobacteraceae bacterium]